MNIIPTAPLPGFAESIIRQQEAAADFSGRDLTQRLQQPGRHISLATGYMESHSPLFAGNPRRPPAFALHARRPDLLGQFKQSPLVRGCFLRPRPSTTSSN